MTSLYVVWSKSIYAMTVLEKITQAAMARDVARKARDSVRRRGTFRTFRIPRKTCRLSNPKKEGTGYLSLKEWLSWWINAKREELREFQAVLPLRGKILNTFVNGKSNGEEHY